MVGDLIYVKKVDVNSIKAGDDITFVLNEDLVVATHQVVRVDAENQHFYTKGDANDIEDANPVHFKNVLGVPQFSIPKLGYVSNYVSNWIKNPPGTYIAIAGCALLVGLTLISGGEDEDKKKKKKKGGEEPEAEAAEAEDIPEDVETKLEELKKEISELQARNEPEASEPRDGDASPPSE